ncbi:MAG: hypothetical protein ABIE74_07120 [Pseudomonadota bacterium]
MVFNALKTLPKGLQIQGLRSSVQIFFGNKATGEAVILKNDNNGDQRDVYASENGRDFFRLITRPKGENDFGVRRHGLPQIDFHLNGMWMDSLTVGIHGDEMQEFEKIGPNQRLGHAFGRKTFYQYPSSLVPQGQYELPDGRTLVIASEHEYQYLVYFAGREGEMEQMTIANHYEDGRVEVDSLGVLKPVNDELDLIKFVSEGSTAVHALSRKDFTYGDAERMGIYLGPLDPTHLRSPFPQGGLQVYSRFLSCNDISSKNAQIEEEVPEIQFAVFPELTQGAAIMVSEMCIGVVTNLLDIAVNHGRVYFSTHSLATRHDEFYSMDGEGNVQQIEPQQMPDSSNFSK